MSSVISRYTADLNLRGVNDAHILAIGRVPANSRVLDLGMADGSVAAMLKDMGCRVWGVEIDEVAAEAARPVCKEVVVADLNTLDLARRFEGRRFDVILMLDILEHLSDPVAVLKSVKSVVAESGWGVISLPNVAHISLRLSLLEGHFSYTDVGLLDRTHLRFFDRAGVDDLLRQAGWEMFDMVRVTRQLGTTEVHVDDADPELVRQLESEPEALTYQFVVSAAPLGSAVLRHPPVLPAAVAQSAFMEVQAHVAKLEEEVRKLRLMQLPDLVEQLAAIRASGIVRRGHLKHLLAALRENSERLSDRLSG
jgi:2-polyprenyl-3-methyl-5-hydroxy-6-metoxy-1,4-benzoquinol methylase